MARVRLIFLAVSFAVCFFVLPMGAEAATISLGKRGWPFRKGGGSDGMGSRGGEKGPTNVGGGGVSAPGAKQPPRGGIPLPGLAKTGPDSASGSKAAPGTARGGPNAQFDYRNSPGRSERINVAAGHLVIDESGWAVLKKGSVSGAPSLPKKPASGPGGMSYKGPVDGAVYAIPQKKKNH